MIESHVTSLGEPITDFPGYFISRSGVVYSTKYGPVLPLKAFNHRGYRRVVLSRNNTRHQFPVHRLVAKQFIPNPRSCNMVNHKDGNRENNSVDNLEWCTAAENQRHSREVLGNTGRGYKNHNYGYRKSRFYPSENLRSRLIELGVPRRKHDIVSLGDMLPNSIDNQRFHSAKCSDETWHLYYEQELGVKSNTLVFDQGAATEADARANLLIHLIEEGIVNPTSL